MFRLFVLLDYICLDLFVLFCFDFVLSPFFQNCVCGFVLFLILLWFYFVFAFR